MSGQLIVLLMLPFEWCSRNIGPSHSFSLRFKESLLFIDAMPGLRNLWGHTHLVMFACPCVVGGLKGVNYMHFTPIPSLQPQYFWTVCFITWSQKMMYYFTQSSVDHDIYLHCSKISSFFPP